VKPPMESFVEGGKLIVRAELPGIDPKEITVNVVGDMLMIRASRQEEHETKKRDFLHREFKYGALERSMTLPQGVKAEDIKANFSNGLLQLTIPTPRFASVGLFCFKQLPTGCRKGFLGTLNPPPDACSNGPRKTTSTGDDQTRCSRLGSRRAAY
jgi:HSP20 family protein